MSKRSSLPVLAALGTLMVLVLGGCAAREAVHPLSTYVAPDFSSRGIKTIALMPFSDRGTAELGSPTVLPLVEARVFQKTGYLFLSQEEIAGRAMKTNVKDQYDRLTATWKKGEEPGKEDVISMGKVIAADALLCGEVFNWSKQWVAANEEGTSQRQVGIKRVLVSAATGEKIWEASDEQTLKSAYYSPESGIGTYVDSGGMVRQYSTAGVPDPPPYEEVAGRVLDAIFRVFP